VNLSKSGASLSVGKRGETVNFGPRGERVTVGIPGTGMSYSKQISSGGARSGRGSKGNALVGLAVMVGAVWLLIALIGKF
jgi:hypothetical protein